VIDVLRQWRSRDISVILTGPAVFLVCVGAGAALHWWALLIVIPVVLTWGYVIRIDELLLRW